MKGLFECIPNFSEGRRPEVLEAIRGAATIDNVRVLGIEGDPDHNRAVMTLAGPPEPLLEAVFRAAKTAMETIDLRQHEGTHPRIGAVDVVPFVPLEGASMADAVRLAHQLGDRVGAELELPGFFYEEAAQRPSRRNLADVRRGQFEALAEKFREDPPDFGPSAPHRSAGAVAIGARRPLIAFNVYLDTQDMNVARAVARAVRGSSGGLIGVKALAFDTKRQGRVQVSMNLVNYPLTPLPRALALVRGEADRAGVRVSETELVGFMPMKAVEDIVTHYLQLPHFTQQRILEVALQEEETQNG